MNTDFLSAIDAKQDEIIKLADTIWENPEIAFKEYKSSAAIISYLKENVMPYVLLTGKAGQTIKNMLQDADYKGNMLEYTDMESAFEIVRNMSKNGERKFLTFAIVCVRIYSEK